MTKGQKMFFGALCPLTEKERKENGQEKRNNSGSIPNDPLQPNGFSIYKNKGE